MSVDNLNDPQTRVSRNGWYLYYDRSSARGDGAVRAVIEVVIGHKPTFRTET